MRVFWPPNFGNVDEIVIVGIPAGGVFTVHHSFHAYISDIDLRSLVDAYFVTCFCSCEKQYAVQWFSHPLIPSVICSWCDTFCRNKVNALSMVLLLIKFN